MYERRERSLPLDSLVKLADLEKALKKFSPVPQERELCVNISHPSFDPGSITGKLQKEIEQSKEGIEQLKDNLFYMRSTYELLQCWGRLLAWWECRGDAGYKKWLGLYMSKHSDRMERVSPEKQFMLQHRIETKLAALAVTEQALALLSSSPGPPAPTF